MTKLLLFSIFYLALWLVEMMVGFGGLLFYSFYTLNTLQFHANMDGELLWTYWRVLFYGVPSVAIFWACYRSSAGLSSNRRLLLFSAVNLFTYVGLSVISESIWKNVPLPAEGILFAVTCVALVVSPLLVGQIPFFRRQMDRS
jgi:hypothetical protein